MGRNSDFSLLSLAGKKPNRNLCIWFNTHWESIICQALSLPQTPEKKDSAHDGKHSLSEVSQIDKTAVIGFLRQCHANSALVFCWHRTLCSGGPLIWHRSFRAVPSSLQDFRSCGGSWRSWRARRRVWPTETQQQRWVREQEIRHCLAQVRIMSVAWVSGQGK